jgi:hypothetical protein
LNRPERSGDLLMWKEAAAMTATCGASECAAVQYVAHKKGFKTEILKPFVPESCTWQDLEFFERHGSR